MTFKELQDAVMERLNLTTVESRTRIKRELNLRNAEITSSVNLGSVRRATVAKDTTVGEALLTFSDVAHVYTLYDPVHLQDVLHEVSLNELREQDADSSEIGYPRVYAIYSHLMDSLTITLYPKPSSVQSLRADVLALGAQLVTDGDMPAFPVDFHDALIHGVLYDESLKIEKQSALTKGFKVDYEQRKSELRLFMAKRSYKSRTQNSRYYDWIGPRRWGPMGVP